jgi:chorismate mutase
MQTDGPKLCRGVRGAISVDADGDGAFRRATVQLLERVVESNECSLDDVAALIFTIPDELAGSNPAAIARENGWSSIPLLMVKEHGGDTRVERCLRILLLWNTSRAQADIRHVYLGEARALRPDAVGDAQTRSTP